MRKTIIIATGVLVFLFLTIFFITRRSSNLKLPNSFPTPTSNLPAQAGFQSPNQLPNQNPSSIIQSFSPVETDDFIAQYSPSLNKVTVQEKTSDAANKFYQWAEENNYPELVNQPDLVEFTDSSTQSGSGTKYEESPGKLLIDFLNIFLNFGQGASSNNQSPSSNLQSPNSLPNQNPSSNFIYYAQCDGYGNVSLPDSCSLCQAGCGPTTVAMIASSYLETSYDPQTIVNLYQSKGYLLGCVGSRYSDAKSLLESLGLKTTDYLIYNYEKADQIVPDFKKYLDNGWTLFVLASFKQSAGGHYFWVTEVDDQGNIWAYDPYYGRYSDPPINENSRYPFPLYRVAFGVKR